MITWLAAEEFRKRLAAYPPIGLSLRAFFHARTMVDPSTWFSRAPEEVEEHGLGSAYVFHGLFDSVPFEISAMRRRSNAWGFEVRLPDRLDGDRRSIETIAGLGLPRWSHPYFVAVPIVSGFAVVEVGELHPLYVASERGDVGPVLNLLNAVEPTRYTIAPTHIEETAWVVSGPDSGPYHSAMEIVDQEASALRLAKRETERTGIEFRVRRVG